MKRKKKKNSKDSHIYSQDNDGNRNIVRPWLRYKDKLKKPYSSLYTVDTFEQFTIGEQNKHKSIKKFDKIH